MTVTINAVSGTGVVTTSDGSGIVKLQSNSVTTNALAWVNFNGTGTVAIRSSYNVSSITDNGTGDYTINFATALSDTNYAAVFGGGSQTVGIGAYVTEQNDSVIRSTTQLRIYTTGQGSILRDTAVVSVSIFGN